MTKKKKERLQQKERERRISEWKKVINIFKENEKKKRMKIKN